MDRVCVYCGSSPGKGATYVQAAQGLAQEIVNRGMGLVYGGASVGTMGVLADTVLAGGGMVYGVIPQSLVDKEVAHHGLTELKIVASMHERKALMAKYSDGFIALPGGLGTLEELFEALTWTQLGFHQKPCALLNIDGYYDPLIAFLDHSVNEGFVREEHRQMLLVDDSPAGLLEQMADYQSPVTEKWIEAGGI